MTHVALSMFVHVDTYATTFLSLQQARMHMSVVDTLMPVFISDGTAIHDKEIVFKSYTNL